MLTPNEDQLSARIHAVSHILTMLIRILQAKNHGIAESIADTIEGRLVSILKGADEDSDRIFAETFRVEALSILGHHSIVARLEDGEPPTPLS